MARVTLLTANCEGGHFPTTLPVLSVGNIIFAIWERMSRFCLNLQYLINEGNQILVNKLINCIYARNCLFPLITFCWGVYTIYIIEIINLLLIYKYSL